MAKNPSDLSDETNRDASIVSFVVRTWREEDPSPDKPEEIWRGHVTPLPDGTRRYFKNIKEIPQLLIDYIKSMKPK